MKLSLGIPKAPLGCVAVLLSLSTTLPAQAATFNFTEISDSSNSPFRIYRNAAINDRGLVAFEAFPSLQSPPVAIFAGSGGQSFPLAISGNGPFNATFNASLNNKGMASFTGNLVDLPNIDPNSPPPANPTVTLLRSGIYTSDGNNLNTIADNTGAFGPFNFFGSSAINDAGTVAFLAGFGQGSVGIFTSKDGTIAPLVSTLGPFRAFAPNVDPITDVVDYAKSGFIDTVGGDGPFAIYTIPAINNSGTVAFTAELDTDKAGVFTVSEDRQVTTIADTSSVFTRFSSASINNQGTVAFLADLLNGERGLFVSSEQGLKTIADTSGPFSFFNSDPAINDNGTVAFLAGLDSGGKGIFTGTDPVNDKVIGVGDSLAGLTVLDLIIIGKGLNNLEQVAFSALLSDGSERVFQAEAVPEPTTVTSVALTGLAGIWLKRKRRKACT